MKIFLAFLVCVETVQSIKVNPIRGEVVSYNTNYFRNVQTRARRNGRGTPYHVDFSGETVYEAGNNITMLIKFYEVISGRNIPLPAQVEFKLCDFFNNEQLLGQLIYKQVPKNFTCPFLPGFYALNNLLFDMELSFDVPFTANGIETLMCLHFIMHASDHSSTEEYLHLKYIAKIIQKPRKKSS